MEIKINGEKKIIENNLSLAELLKHFNIDDKYNVIAVNYLVIAKEKYDSYRIENNDEIEILSPMQGG